jgi:hypothetical protein
MPGIGPRVRHWVKTSEHLRYGCLNPAVVLDSRTGLVAVFTSLTAVGTKPWPVVKTVRERPDMVQDSRVVNGSRFAAASIYRATQDSWAQSRWSDFFPIIVDCLIDDRRCCEDAVARIKPLAWACLEIALKQLDSKSEEGLFRVSVPDDLVWNAY